MVYYKTIYYKTELKENGSLTFKKKKNTYLKERARTGGAAGEGKRISSRLHADYGAQLGA